LSIVSAAKDNSDILYVELHSAIEWFRLADYIKDSISQKHNKVLLSFGWEANMLVDWERPDSIFIFDALHRVVEETGLPYDMFYFCNGNAFLEKCYKKWLIDTNQQNQIAGVFYHYSHFFNTIKNISLSDTPNKDWYNEQRYNIKPKYFSCLNNRASTSRINALFHLHDNKLLDKSISTFVFDPDTIHKLNHLRPDIAKILPMTLEEPGKFLRFDLVPDTFWFKTERIFFDTYSNSYYDLVNETIQHLNLETCVFPTETSVFPNFNIFPIKQNDCYSWDHNVFITEKLIRNFFNKRPFLIVCGHQSLKVLHSLGFRTFDKILFDESYDNIVDPMERLGAVLEENLRIVNTYELQQLHNIIYSSEMESILNHNFNRAVEISNLSDYDLLEKYLT